MKKKTLASFTADWLLPFTFASSSKKSISPKLVSNYCFKCIFSQGCSLFNLLFPLSLGLAIIPKKVTCTIKQKFCVLLYPKGFKNNHLSQWGNQFCIPTKRLKWVTRLIIGVFRMVSSTFLIVQILVHSLFDLVCLLVAIEATALISEPVTQMAFELIKHHLISVQQKR